MKNYVVCLLEWLAIDDWEIVLLGNIDRRCCRKTKTDKLFNTLISDGVLNLCYIRKPIISMIFLLNTDGNSDICQVYIEYINDNK